MMVQAKSYNIEVCKDPTCRCVHFIMYGDHNDDRRDGQVTASAAVPLQSIHKLISNVQEAAYAVAALKDTP